MACVIELRKFFDLLPPCDTVRWLGSQGVARKRRAAPTARRGVS